MERPRTLQILSGLAPAFASKLPMAFSHHRCTTTTCTCTHISSVCHAAYTEQHDGLTSFTTCRRCSGWRLYAFLAYEHEHMQVGPFAHVTHGTRAALIDPKTRWFATIAPKTMCPSSVIVTGKVGAPWALQVGGSCPSTSTGGYIINWVSSVRPLTIFIP